MINNNDHILLSIKRKTFITHITYKYHIYRLPTHTTHIYAYYIEAAASYIHTY